MKQKDKQALAKINMLATMLLASVLATFLLLAGLFALTRIPYSPLVTVLVGLVLSFVAWLVGVFYFGLQWHREKNFGQSW